MIVDSAAAFRLARPLSYWSRRDVFAHLRAAGVPEAVRERLYGMTTPELRLAVLSCDTGCLRGDLREDGSMVRLTPWHLDAAKIRELSTASAKTRSPSAYICEAQKSPSAITAVLTDEEAEA